MEKKEFIRIAKDTAKSHHDARQELPNVVEDIDEATRLARKANIDLTSGENIENLGGKGKMIIDASEQLQRDRHGGRQERGR